MPRRRPLERLLAMTYFSLQKALSLLLKISKNTVIANQCAHWCGNPFPSIPGVMRVSSYSPATHMDFPTGSLPFQKVSEIWSDEGFEGIKVALRQAVARGARPRRIYIVRIPIPAIKNADTRMGICIFWQRMRDSNPRKRSQSPVCYRYTNPLGGDNRTRTCDLMRVKHAL